MSRINLSVMEELRRQAHDTFNRYQRKHTR